MAAREISDFTKKKPAKKKQTSAPTPDTKAVKPKTTVKPKVKAKPVVKEPTTTKDKLPAKKIVKKKKKKAETLPTKVTRDNIDVQGQQLIQAGRAQIERLQDSAFDKNREHIDEYTAMFDSLVYISREAMRKYRDSHSSKDIYPLLKTYESLREVIADLKALQDVGEYIEQIDINVLRPLSMTFAQILMNLVRGAIDHSRKTFTPEVADSLERHIRSQASTAGIEADLAYKTSLENTRMILVG